MIPIAVVGASGRMGAAVVKLAHEHELLVVATASEGDDLSAIERSPARVIVDFSAPSAMKALTELAVRGRMALVSGTTGLDDAAMRALDDASKHVAVLWAPNMSVGVAVLGDLLRRAIAKLGPGFDIEITETHHKRKVDAPSGTALRLAHIAAEARGEATEVHGRTGKPGARADAEIGVLAVRGGDVIGDHTIHLLGAGERLELTHRATSRDLFALGALRAAAFVADKPAGRYDLGSVLR